MFRMLELAIDTLQTLYLFLNQTGFSQSNLLKQQCIIICLSWPGHQRPIKFI